MEINRKPFGKRRQDHMFSVETISVNTYEGSEINVFKKFIENAIKAKG
jgi:hypothetical protein